MLLIVDLVTSSSFFLPDVIVMPFNVRPRRVFVTRYSCEMDARPLVHDLWAPPLALWPMFENSAVSGTPCVIETNLHRI